MLGRRALWPLAAAPAGDDVAGAYRRCREITRRNSRTFYLSSLFLAPPKRRAVWAVYAFCRVADDIVDRIAPADERLAALDAWEAQLRWCYDGSAIDPIYIALGHAASRFGIPMQPALDLLRGARTDVTVRRYDTYENVREYCYLVASTVGLLTAPILGTQTDEALAYGVALGHAMQMTNILRDVGEDARLDRIYLPGEEIARFGYSEERLLEGIVDAAFVALMQFQIERVRALYHEAAPGIEMLAPESRYTVRLALTLYRGILDSIEANGYDVFAKRAYVPLRTKALHALLLTVR